MGVAHGCHCHLTAPSLTESLDHWGVFIIIASLYRILIYTWWMMNVTIQINDVSIIAWSFLWSSFDSIPNPMIRSILLKNQLRRSHEFWHEFSACAILHSDGFYEPSPFVLHEPPSSILHQFYFFISVSHHAKRMTAVRSNNKSKRSVGTSFVVCSCWQHQRYNNYSNTKWFD